MSEHIIAWLKSAHLILPSKEKAGLFRRYAQLNSLATIAAFAVGATWIIISATRHNTAQKACEQEFFPQDSSGETSSEGETMCKIFPWVDVGLMGGLWGVLVIMQVRFRYNLCYYSTALNHVIIAVHPFCYLFLQLRSAC